MRRQPQDKRLRDFELLCRERGLPLTVQRRVLLQAIVGREDHPTADQIYAELKGRLPGISRTSVYRILELLMDAGMVTKVLHPGSAARFDPKLHPHHHLVCWRCERIIDVEEPRLNCLPLPDVRAHGFQISGYQIHFQGACAACLRKRKTKTRLTRPVGRPKAGPKVKTTGQKERRGR